MEVDEEGSSGSESEKSVHTQATRESLDPEEKAQAILRREFPSQRGIDCRYGH